MSIRKIIVIALVVAGLLGLIALGLAPQPVLVELVEVERGRLEVTVEEEGRTRVRDRYTVSAPVSGYADRVVLEPGDPVAVGQVLATITPARPEALDPRRRAQAEARVAGARAALRSAENRVRSAAAEANLAAVEFERLQRLAVRDLVSRAEVDRAETAARSRAQALEEAEANVDVAREELRATQTELTYAGAASEDPGSVITVRSPIDGRVLARHRESEGMLPSGAALLDLGDTGVLEVETDVLSRDAVRIAAGQPVRFLRWGGDGDLQGEVLRVEPGGFTKISALGVEEQRVWVISTITDDPMRWQGLGDGYRVESEFIIWADDDVVTVPTSALFRHDGGWAVFRADDGRVTRVPVSLGQRAARLAQVLDGLSPGDLVVPHPPEDLDDGARVRMP